MNPLAKIFLILAIFLSHNNSIGQIDSLNTIPHNYKIIKFALGNLIWQAIRIKGMLNLSVEEEIGLNRKFSLFVAGDYTKWDSRVYLNGVLVSSSKSTNYSFRPGVRFYLRESPNGLFVGSSLIYQRRIESDGFEKRHELGLIGGIGWQKVIKKRVSFDTYLFYGRTKSWFKSRFINQSPRGKEYLSSGVLLINIGLVRYKKE